MSGPLDERAGGGVGGRLAERAGVSGRLDESAPRNTEGWPGPEADGA